MKLPSRIKACFLLLLTACPVASIAAPLDTVSSPSLAAAAGPEAVAGDVTNATKAFREPPPLALDLIELLERQRFDRLERTFSELLANYRPSEPYSYRPIQIALNHLRSRYRPEYAPIYSAWCEQYPNSAISHLTRGFFLIDHAWDARGSGFATTVSPQDWSTFHERLRAARLELERAIGLSQDTMPFPYHGLLILAYAEGTAEERVFALLQKSVAIDRFYPAPYDSVMEYLRPRWHGSVSKMFAFARSSIREAPAESVIPGIILAAYEELLPTRKDWKNPEMMAEVVPILRRIIAHFPERYYYRERLFLIASINEEWPLAMEMNEALGIRVTLSIWSSLGSYLSERGRVQARGGETDFAAQYKWALAEFEKLSPPSNTDAGLCTLHALAYQHFKRYQEAGTLFNRALELSPSDYQVQCHAAYYLLHYGNQPERARAIYEKLASQVSEPEILYNYGVALKLTGHAEEAIPYYERAIAENPAWPGYYNGLAALLRDRGEMRQMEQIAARGLDAARALQDKRPLWTARLLKTHGDALFYQGRYREAIADYRSSLEQQPQPETHYMLYRALAWNNENDPEALGEALTALLEAQRLSENRNPTWGASLIELRGKLGQIDQALSDARSLIESHPGDALIPLAIGNVLVGHRRHEESLPYLNRSLELQPDSIPAQVARADSLLTLKRTDEASSAVQRLLQQPIADLGMNQKIVYMLHRSSRYEDLLRATDNLFNQVDLSTTPEIDAHYRFYRGDALAHLGRCPEALADCERALEAQDTNPSLHALIARILLEPGTAVHDPTRGLQHARKAVDQSGNRDPYYLGLLADALAENGRNDEALALNRELYERNSQDFLSLYRIRMLEADQKPQRKYLE